MISGKSSAASTMAATHRLPRIPLTKSEKEEYDRDYKRRASNKMKKIKQMSERNCHDSGYDRKRERKKKKGKMKHPEETEGTATRRYIKENTNKTMTDGRCCISYSCRQLKDMIHASATMNNTPLFSCAIQNVLTRDPRSGVACV